MMLQGFIVPLGFRSRGPLQLLRLARLHHPLKEEARR